MLTTIAQIIVKLVELLGTRIGNVIAIGTSLLVIATNALEIMNRAKSAMSLMDGVVAGAVGTTGTSLSPFAFMNHLLPLDLGLAWFTIWINFFILCATVRTVKAWIPTLS